MNVTPIEAGVRGASRARAEIGSTRACLRGTPQEVLARLADGDPLRIARRVSRHLAQQRLLLDEHRVYLRSLAFVARASQRYRGRPGLERWLDQQVTRAVASLQTPEPGGPPGTRWSDLAAGFGLNTMDLDRACAEFHDLPFEARDAFYALVLEGQAIESLVYPGSRSATSIARDARRALAIFLGLRPQPCSQEVNS